MGRTEFSNALNYKLSVLQNIKVPFKMTKVQSCAQKKKKKEITVLLSSTLPYIILYNI